MIPRNHSVIGIGYCIARPIRFSWLMLPLMGFECVMSEHPLVSLEEGFIDEALVGHWIETSDGTELVISMRDDGLMNVEMGETDEGERSFYAYRGYSSRLGEDTYANLEFFDVGCEGCDQGELDIGRAEIFEDFAPILAETDGATCTFIIIRYEHTEDDRLIVYWQRRSNVKSAIEEQELAGRLFAETDSELDGEPCITASSTELVEWIIANPEALSSATDSDEYVRRR